MTIHEDVTQQLLAATAEGELDLRVAALPIDHEQLHVERLMSEPLLLGLPVGHRLAQRRRITMAELRKERFILQRVMETHWIVTRENQANASTNRNVSSPSVLVYNQYLQ